MSRKRRAATRGKKRKVGEEEEQENAGRPMVPDVVGEMCPALLDHQDQSERFGSWSA